MIENVYSFEKRAICRTGEHYRTYLTIYTSMTSQTWIEIAEGDRHNHNFEIIVVKHNILNCFIRTEPSKVSGLKT